MSEPEDATADLLKKLLHTGLKTRKEGFYQLQMMEWKSEYRQYLWKAIEQERDRSHQLKLVGFALDILKDKSLRKMIRFVEQDQLQKKAYNHLVKRYPLYETDLVRQALLKSLHREGSHTYKFVCDLLRLYFIPMIGHHRYEELTENLQTLIMDVLAEDIDNRQRQEYVVIIMNRYFKETAFRNELSPYIWDFLKSDDFLYQIVLNGFFNPDPSLDLKIAVLPKTHQALLWHNWKWQIPGQDIRFNDYIHDLGQEEWFVIDACRSENPKIRAEAIEVIGTATISTQPKIGLSATYLREKLYPVWDLVSSYQLQYIFLNLEEISEDSLLTHFPAEINLDDQNVLIEKIGSKSITILQLLQTYNVNPHDLISHIVAYLPRHLLAENAEYDNSTPLRVAAFQNLLDPRFTIHPDGAVDPLIGPPRYWIDRFTCGITNMLTKNDSKIYESVTSEIFTLINRLQLNNHSILHDPIIEEIEQMESKIDELKDLEHALPAYYKLKSLISDINPKISSGLQLTAKQQKLLLQDMIGDYKQPSAQDSIRNIILDGKSSVLEYALEKVTTTLESEDLRENINLQLHLLEILNNLIDSKDIRVRTKSKPIKRELEQSLLKLLLHDESIEDHLEIIQEILSKAGYDTLKMVLSQIKSELQKSSLDIYRDILQMMIESHDPRISREAQTLQD